MHLLLILLGLAVAIVAIVLFFANRPRLHRVKGGLDFLSAYGREGAEFRFIHTPTGKEIAFRLHLVGGVKQIYFLVDRLQLVPEERAALLQILEPRGLKLQARRNRAKSEYVNVGHSTETANELACQVAAEVMRWTGLTRFKFEDNMDFSLSGNGKRWVKPG
jgi:hypothetical protein